MRVELHNITKTFGRVRANQDISFTFKPGQIYAILGENGAGNPPTAARSSSMGKRWS
jgi:ABC-type uncharacterized transport system ATPase subunit